MKELIKSDNAPQPIGPYSQAVLVGNTLYTSGQIAIHPKTNELVIDNIKDETDLVMRNIQALLNEAGMDFNHVVKCSIFIADMNNFSSINEVYGKYFTSNYPARETVEVACLPKNVNVEISVIAVKQ